MHKQFDKSLLKRLLRESLLLGVGDISTAGGGGSSSGGSAFQVPQEISTVSLEALGGKGMGLPAGNTTAFATSAWFSASTALFIPFVVNGSFSCKNIWFMNGAVASGNIDLGIYTSAGVRVASIGSTAQAGTNAPQVVALVASLTPGDYYLAAALDNIVGTCFFGNTITNGGRVLGMAQMASAFPLPSNATFASIAVSSTPFLMGITQRTFV
jgi:hypothetical protein